MDGGHGGSVTSPAEPGPRRGLAGVAVRRAGPHDTRRGPADVAVRRADPHDTRRGRERAGPRGPVATELPVVPKRKSREHAGGIAAARTVSRLALRGASSPLRHP
ncbi:hypothetical protein GCM10023107_48130 [Actinoplanes octamycinicus]|nr:hypothetical protein Aoc01nite_01660 [Actinoplanes octamycinicus]